MSALLTGDHAFADGGVFGAPSGWVAAIRLTRSWKDGRLLLRIWDQFMRGATLGPNVKLGLGARLVNLDARQRVVIHSGAVVRGILRNEPQGRIELGDGVYLGDGTLLSSALEIVIGAGTLVAHGVQVFDNDTHPLDPKERARHFRMILGMEALASVDIGSAPVRIGQSCWIGMNAMVMKGVTVGDETVVAAGSVVVGDVPARVLVGGNPARVIRSL